MIASAGGRRIPVSLAYVGDRRGWQKCLEEHCAELKGHRVVWRKDADPYRLKLMRSANHFKRQFTEFAVG